jgi:uncharacterized protein (TIGR03437 family)
MRFCEMFPSLTRCLLLSTFAGILASAQPKIFADGVRNSASYAPAGFLNTGIAQGSLFVMFGSGLSAADLQYANLPLPTQLGGTTVTISSGGETVSAYLLYVSSNQLAGILPSGTPLGPATITVSYQGQNSNALPITIAHRKVGFYTLNQAGSGPVVAQNFNSANDQPVNTLITPAKPGQIVTLWANGLGPVQGDERSAPQVGKLDPLTIYVGGIAAKVLYAGRSGCCVATDQIIIEVPAGIEGCYVPVIAVTGSFSIPALVGKIPVDGPSSNFVTLSISSNGTCTDPSGLSGEEIQKMSLSPSFHLAALEFDGSAEGFSQDTAAARFSRVDFTPSFDRKVSLVFHRSVPASLTKSPQIPSSSSLWTQVPF